MGAESLTRWQRARIPLLVDLVANIRAEVNRMDEIRFGDAAKRLVRSKKKNASNELWRTASRDVRRDLPATDEEAQSACYWVDDKRDAPVFREPSMVSGQIYLRKKDAMAGMAVIPAKQ